MNGRRPSVRELTAISSTRLVITNTCVRLCILKRTLCTNQSIILLFRDSLLNITCHNTYTLLICLTSNIRGKMLNYIGILSVPPAHNRRRCSSLYPILYDLGQLCESAYIRQETIDFVLPPLGVPRTRTQLCAPIYKGGVLLHGPPIPILDFQQFLSYGNLFSIVLRLTQALIFLLRLRIYLIIEF